MEINENCCHRKISPPPQKKNNNNNKQPNKPIYCIVSTDSVEKDCFSDTDDEDELSADADDEDQNVCIMLQSETIKKPTENLRWPF